MKKSVAVLLAAGLLAQPLIAAAPPYTSEAPIAYMKDLSSGAVLFDKGGETRIFETDGPNGKRFTMLEPWTLLLMDDAAVIHESTPIQPTGPDGHRDTLVLTWRAHGFQGDGQSVANPV